jgi:hypothetical protein
MIEGAEPKKWGNKPEKNRKLASSNEGRNGTVIKKAKTGMKVTINNYKKNRFTVFRDRMGKHPPLSNNTITQEIEVSR